MQDVLEQRLALLAAKKEFLESSMSEVQAEHMYWRAQEKLRKLLTVHVCCPTPSKISGSVLPNSAVLQIFRLLDKKTLVTSARGVCHQWLRLSEHRSLWKTGMDFSLCGVPAYDKEVIQEMRAAPRVNILKIDPLDVDADITRTLRSNLLDYDWKGKIQSLEVNVSPNLVRENNPLWGQLLHKFQEDLTTFKMRGDLPIESTHVLEFFYFINLAPRLSELHVHWSAVFNHRLPVIVRPRFLQTLKIWGQDVESSILVSMLSASRNTLKVVHLPRTNKCSGAARLIIEQLAKCPLLEDVYLPMCPDMTALSECSALTTLKIRASRYTPRVWPHVALVLRSLAGSGLSRLTVNLCSVPQEFCDPLIAAVKVLTQLTSLSVVCDYEPGVAELLRCLPNLEELRVSAFPQRAADVAAITADLAPNLRVLYVNPDFTDAEPHEALDALCEERPLLRIEGPDHYEMCD